MNYEICVNAYDKKLKKDIEHRIYFGKSFIKFILNIIKIKHNTNYWKINFVKLYYGKN